MVPCPLQGTARDEHGAPVSEPSTPGMQGGSGTAPEAPAPTLGTKVAFAASLALLAALLGTSSQSPPPAEARLGQRVELVELIQQEEARARSLQEHVDELSADLARLEDELMADSTEIAELRRALGELEASAGLTPVRGPGVTVTLNDSTSTVPTDGNPNDYIIHEEDLQAVINALWAGGAEAMAVNGDRVIATTAIRCVGNVLLLHGSTHSPPYHIEAIGDPDDLADALERDGAVERFARAVRDYKLGFDVASAEQEPLELRAYEGTVALQEAQPLESVGG
jgi:uncharacterized protein YlxW (UPF0749 family)